ncbi:hypothetical protein [Streptomyces virginiae]|uniref:hypothetical protein n=1 Tax=Streptomyces virginiae TaxID=1961 RepID=UPI00341697A7
MQPRHPYSRSAYASDPVGDRTYRTYRTYRTGCPGFVFIVSGPPSPSPSRLRALRYGKTVNG